MTCVPDQEAKKYHWEGGGGVPLIGLPPQQLHSHHTTGALGHVYKETPYPSPIYSNRETPYPSPIYSNSIPEKCLKIFLKMSF